TGAQQAEDFYKEGMRRMSERNFAEAENFFTKAISLSKDSSSYFYERGRCRFQSRKYNDAYSDYSTAIELDPANSAAYLARAALLLFAMKYDPSIRDANMAIMNSTSRLIKKEAYINNGIARTRQRDYSGAFADMYKALSFDSLDPSLYCEIGNI